jgi:hypothetical protein
MGKVQKAEAKTVTREVKKCDSLDVPPHFAYTNSATVNAAAVDGALALANSIFGGPPVLDASLVTRADNRDTAMCQFEMLKRANKVESTVLKELVIAKRKSLRDQRVDSSAALEATLRAVLSSNKRITAVEGRLVNGVDRACNSLLASPGAIFPGSCGIDNPNDLGQIEACVIAAARCEACLKINAFDNLNLDCDQADDQNTNGSCP